MTTDASPHNPNGPPQPRTKTSAPHRSRLLLWLGWGAAFAFLCTTAWLTWRQLQPIPRATADNIKKVKNGMTLGEVESILGPGREGHLPMVEYLKDMPAYAKANWKHWPGPDLQTGKDVVYNLPFVDDKLVQTFVTSTTGNWELDQSFITRVNTGASELNDVIYRRYPGHAQMHLYEYRGGYVDCWVEVAAGGKPEVIALISAQEMRTKVDEHYAKLGRKIPAEHVRGYIFWDPDSLGPNDPTLGVTCIAADGIELNPPIVIKGTNHLIAEKWKDHILQTWSTELQNGALPPGEEKRLEAPRFSFGELRLMVKSVVCSR